MAPGATANSLAAGDQAAAEAAGRKAADLLGVPQQVVLDILGRLESLETRVTSQLGQLTAGHNDHIAAIKVRALARHRLDNSWTGDLEHLMPLGS